MRTRSTYNHICLSQVTGANGVILSSSADSSASAPLDRQCRRGYRLGYPGRAFTLQIRAIQIANWADLANLRFCQSTECPIVIRSSQMTYSSGWYESLSQLSQAPGDKTHAF